jgi:hypothetical protein
MPPIQFSGRLIDQGFLIHVPSQQAEAFKTAVAQLPDYLTVEVKDQYYPCDKRPYHMVFARVNEALLVESGDSFPPARGDSIRITPTWWQKHFPASLREQEAKVRAVLMQAVLDSAASLQKEVEQLQANRMPDQQSQ